MKRDTKTKPTRAKARVRKPAPRKKVSKAWLAFMKNEKNPGIEIVDRRAVLK